MLSGSEYKSCQEYCQAQKTIRIMTGKMKKKAGLFIWAHVNRKKQNQRFIISIIITGNSGKMPVEQDCIYHRNKPVWNKISARFLLVQGQESGKREPCFIQRVG